MDQMELRSGKTLTERDVKEDSDNDPEEDVHTLLDGYATGGIEKKRRVSLGGQEVLDPAPIQVPTPSSSCNGHLQCPLSAGVSDDVGRFDIYPWPLLAGTARKR